MYEVMIFDNNRFASIELCPRFILDGGGRLIVASFPRLLTNTDSQRVSFKPFPSKRLEFESRFESGNLRKAVQVCGYLYFLLES